ncbi:hypothetical protein [Peribacillus sp. SCS-37]
MFGFLKKAGGKKAENDCCRVEIVEVPDAEKDLCCKSSQEEKDA